METIKKHKVAIIIGILALIAVWYFFLRRKKVTESGYGISGANIGAEHCCDPHCNTRSVGGKCLGVTDLASKIKRGSGIKRGAGGTAAAGGCPDGSIICGTTEGNYPRIKCCDRAGNSRGLGNPI